MPVPFLFWGRPLALKGDGRERVTESDKAYWGAVARQIEIERRVKERAQAKLATLSRWRSENLKAYWDKKRKKLHA